MTIGSPRLSRKSRAASALLAVSLLLMSSACAPSVKIVRVALPEAPAELRQPVAIPEPRAGEHAVLYAGRTKASARQAERKRADFDAWYERVRAELGAQNADDR